MLEYFFEWSGRDLTKIIKAVLNQNLAEEIVRENSIASYKIENKKLEKRQIKKVYFFWIKDNLEEFLERYKEFRRCR